MTMTKIWTSSLTILLTVSANLLFFPFRDTTLLYPLPHLLSFTTLHDLQRQNRSPYSLSLSPLPSPFTLSPLAPLTQITPQQRSTNHPLYTERNRDQQTSSTGVPNRNRKDARSSIADPGDWSCDGSACRSAAAAAGSRPTGSTSTAAGAGAGAGREGEGGRRGDTYRKQKI